MTRHTVWSVLAAGLLALVSVGPTAAQAESELGVQPLHREFSAALASLPPQTQLLLKSESIERFLTALDGHPPDWPTVYGQGHHGPGHDERLFALNRERDAGRVGKDALHWMIAFVWLGELSRFDQEAGGFHVALGPKFTRTGWGDVRFKHEDLPATLIALAGGEGGLRAAIVLAAAAGAAGGVAQAAGVLAALPRRAGRIDASAGAAAARVAAIGAAVAGDADVAAPTAAREDRPRRSRSAATPAPAAPR